MFEWIASPEAWMALATLTALEIVLGIDNIIFISILVGRLPEKQRAFARRLGLSPLWITCNPENVASRRTCERAGGTLVETVKLPPDHPLYQKGERAKCRYRFEV